MKEFEDYILEMKKLQLQGETKVYIVETSSDLTIVDIVKNRQEAINVLGPHIAKINGHQGIKYEVFRYCFVLGVLLVAIARAYPILA